MRNYWQDVARAAEAAGWTYEPPTTYSNQPGGNDGVLTKCYSGLCPVPLGHKHYAHRDAILVNPNLPTTPRKADMPGAKVERAALRRMEWGALDARIASKLFCDTVDQT